MLTPLLFAALLQAAAAPQDLPKQPAGPGQTAATEGDRAMPGTRSAPSPAPETTAPGATQGAAETAQPTPRPDPATLPAETQFARYDGNGDGSLDMSEFSAWLVALRSAKEADFDGTKLEARAWIERSFTATDANRDQKISRTEWVRFLTPTNG